MIKNNLVLRQKTTSLLKWNHMKKEKLREFIPLLVLVVIVAFLINLALPALNSPGFQDFTRGLGIFGPVFGQSSSRRIDS